ncbi:MAG: ABC transporter permease [Bacteroidaceae bacterium]|nr:ABC transporter permease [Bacteroidaceae bacterium]
MITKIIKQLWNEKGDNVWLFVELVIVSIFLWHAVDPLYTLNRASNFPKGFNPENICRVYIHKYEKYNKEYDASVDNETDDASITAVFNNIVSLPEIESYYGGFGIPYSGTFSTIHLYYNENGEEDNGEGRKDIEPYYYAAERGEFFKVLQIKDIKTGQYLTQLQKGEIQLSRSAAMELFGTTDCIGREVENEYGIRKLKITGVYEDFQPNPYMIPEPTVVANYADNPPEFIYMRLKEGVDRDSFIKRFNEELRPTLRVGNRYAGTMVDFEYVIEQNMYNVIHESKNRFQLFISFFALFCAFLGIVSTFWIRTNDRRGEIGIMRSVGASRRRIIGQFVTEALLLVTMAFAVALPLIIHIVASNDFAQPLSATNEQLAAYSNIFAPLPRFAVITATTYFIIAATAVIAAVIPAAKASNTNIANTLKEE